MNVIYHVSPKEENRREIWRQNCNNPNPLWNPKRFYICSQHFTNESYERDLEHELLNLPPRKKLKDTAVPSLCLQSPSSTLSFAFQQDINVNIEINTPDPIEDTVQEDPRTAIERLKKEMAQLQKQSAETIKSLEEDKIKFARLLNEANESVKALTSENTYLKAQIKNKKPRKESKAEPEKN